MSITLNPSTATATSSNAISSAQRLPAVRLGRHTAGLPGLAPMAHSQHAAPSSGEGRHANGTVTVAQLVAAQSLRPLADQLTSGLTGGQR